jgi:TolB-like protein
VQPHPDDVRRQLDRILASGTFATTDRLSRFLRFVVERTLAGEGDQLKEYAVGVGVFDRGEQYDPRTDAIVRVEASRLRTKIDEYYRLADGADPILIRLPKGSYAPLFEVWPSDGGGPVQADGPSPARSRRWLVVGAATAAIVLVAFTYWRTAGQASTAVTLAVLPFETFSADPERQLLAARVTDGVTTEAARLGTVGVVSHTSALQFTGVRRPVRDIAQALGATVLLEGTIEVSDGRVRVSVRLVDGALDRKLWVDDVEGAVADLPALCRDIAAAAVGAARRLAG